MKELTEEEFYEMTNSKNSHEIYQIYLSADQYLNADMVREMVFHRIVGLNIPQVEYNEFGERYLIVEDDSPLSFDYICEANDGCLYFGYGKLEDSDYVTECALNKPQMDVILKYLC